MTVFIEQNPFAILGVTTRDNRHAIVERADEVSLTGDHDLCTRARADLTNPRNRLAAELSWLPGVSPKRANELLGLIKTDPAAIREKSSSVSPLAQANLMASAFEVLDPKGSEDEWVGWILDMATAVDKIQPDAVLRDINEDRSVSGFAPVKSVDVVEAELLERTRYYKDAIKAALDRLPSLKLLSIVTQAVDEATYKGQKHAPHLIDELVDSFALSLQTFLQKGADNIRTLVTYIKKIAPKGNAAVEPQLKQLETIVVNWDKYAQPIQVSTRSRGIEHDMSRDVAYSIRGLGVELANEHGLIEAAAITNKILQGSFSELTELADRVQEDASTLEDLLEQKEQQQTEDAEWENEITYEATIGVLGREKFSISPKGISWQGIAYPLKSVTNLRWGGVRHSVNGIPTGTSYTIGFGDNQRSGTIETRNNEIYSAIVDKLWRAIGVRLMFELLAALGEGKKLNFGDAVVQDTGVEVTTHKFFKNERVFLDWSQVHVWSQGGNFYIGHKDDKKSYSEISYIEHRNAHVLESTIRMAFKKGCGKRISSVLDR